MTEPTVTFVPADPALAIAREGRGSDTLLFLHGIGGNWRNWRRQLSAFGRHFTSLAWDLRGYGDSGDYEGPCSFDDWSNDVLRVIEHFGVGQIHLVGLSLGGRIAQRFCLTHPDRVASLVLADTRSETGNTRTPEQKQAFYDLRARPLLEGKTMADIAPSIAESLMSDSAPAYVRDELVESMCRIRPDAYLRAISANLAEDYSGDVSRIHVPTLVVVGEKDRLTPPELAKQLASEIPGARFVQILNAGHLSNIEAPELFNEALLQFYREIGLKLD